LKRTLIVLAGAAVACVALLASAGAQGVVYAPKDCSKAKVEPKRITLACADDGILLKRLSWSDWNLPKVNGKGKLLINDCDPNCASGTFDKYKVKVTLLNVQTYTCGGKTVSMYRRAHVRFRGKQPPNANSYRSTKLFCD
jgi:hypothetical protein